MPYQTLAKLFHQNSSADRYADLERLAAERLVSESSVRTGIILEAGELFFLVTPELALLSEKTLRSERTVSRVWQELPQVAQRAYLHDLINAEIFYSNEIEGVRSTRREIAEALRNVQEAKREQRTLGQKRFVEFAALYLGLTDQQGVYPETARDIRAIYDQVTAGEIAENDRPDGKIFRAGSVEVVSAAKTLHAGVFPEQRIIEVIEGMLALTKDESIPQLYSAALSHFIFEYAHPFYDGNGRTGRYLLSVFLNESLSLPTVLSLSRTIAEHKAAYYAAFEETEDPLNHADATVFIFQMLTLLRLAQSTLLDNLLSKQKALKDAQQRIGARAALDSHAKDALYLLAQDGLFSAYPGVSALEVAETLQVGAQTARKYLAGLEACGLAEPISLRPKRFALSEDGAKQLGL
ncbi:MAG: Fic family protein [Coriobacteriales bacterium]|jgi:Fic family protein|nr:Fic family protein [Coriobacteriales bacterium]